MDGTEANRTAGRAGAAERHSREPRPFAGMGGAAVALRPRTAAGRQPGRGDRFNAGEGVAAGLHIHDAGTNTWNEAVVETECSGQDAVLLSWAARRRGLISRPENADRCSAVSDLAGRKVAARQRESGTDILLRHLLVAAGIPADAVRFTEPVRSEQDAVLAVAEGLAEATFGLESVAKPFSLAFAPLVLERFDILVDRRAYFDEPFQALLAFCGSPAFAERADALGGYDVAGLGEVRWTA